MKALTKISIGFLALAAVALWFTSCSSEDVAQNGGSQSDKESLLTLTINTGKIMGSRTTDWTSDPAGADASQTESKISEITIGIFDGTTKNVKAIIEPTKGTDNAAPGNGQFTYSTTDKKITAKVIAKALSVDDDVLVAVNHAGNFGSVSDEKSFNAVTESLSEALGTGAKQDNTNIPMYGTGKLVAGTSTNSFTADDIAVKRLLAKITLDNLSVDFSGIYAGAEFTPTCCFLINVPEKLKFADGKDSWDMTAALNSGWAKYDGTFDYTTKNDNIGTGVNFNQFLTTGNLSGTALKGAKNSGTEAYSGKVFFYTMPNGNDKASTNKNTKLVIAGKFKANSDAQEQMVYYPVPLNVNIATGGTVTPGQDDKYKVYPNKNYICDVTIKTIGVANPNLNLDPQDATITINVENWTSVNQTTIFD